MRIKEIEVGYSGVIPLASYENFRPSYLMKVELDDRDNPKEVTDKLRAFIRQQFELDVNRCKTDRIAAEYANLRFYDMNGSGKRYPSLRFWGGIPNGKLARTS